MVITEDCKDILQCNNNYIITHEHDVTIVCFKSSTATSICFTSLLECFSAIEKTCVSFAGKVDANAFFSCGVK